MVSKDTSATKEDSKTNTDAEANAARRRNEEIQREKEAETRRLEALRREILEREAAQKEREAADTRNREQPSQFEPISVKNTDGSSFTQNAQGQISSTTDKNGTVRQFTYDDKGDLNSFTEAGKVWSSKDGSNWQCPGETPRILRAVVNAEDGTFAIAEQGNTRVFFLNGNTLQKDASGSTTRDTQTPTTEKRRATQERKTDAETSESAIKKQIDVVDRKQMEAAADAFYANTAGRWGTGEEEVNAILKDKTEAEKRVMDEIYRSKYGSGLEDVIKDEMSGSDLEKGMALLKKKDGSADDAGRLHTNLAELNEYFGRSNFNIEKDIRQTISTMNSSQVEELEKDYQQRYNKSLRQSLMEDPNLSKDSKEMLAIYIKGTDKRTNDDSQKLFDIALKSGDVERFNESAATASATARKQFMENGGREKLATAFTEGSTSFNHALEYANSGRLSTASKVSDNTSWLGDNEEAIERSIKEMSADERKNYLNGKLLSEGKSVEGLSNEEAVQAKSTYESINKALQGAGDSWEIAKWEDQIAVKGGSLVTALAAHRGTFYDDSTHLVLKDIENMSQEDWKSYKADAGYRQRVDTVLKDYLSTEDYTRAKTLLNEKATAENYEGSKKLANRDLVTVIQDNEGILENDEVEIWNAIENMSAEEQEKYRSDKQFRASVDEAVARSLDAGAEQNVATGMLQRVLQGGSPKADIVDKLNKHASDFDTDEGAVIRDIEKAFAEDPTLRERINSPKTEADKNLAFRFDTALRKALDPSEYDRYAKQLLLEGRIDQSLKQELNTGYFNDDEQSTYSDMATLGQSKDKKAVEEKSIILSDKSYQDKVLGHLSEDERTVALYALTQGELRPEDKIRSQMLGAGTGENEIKEVLRQLSPQQKEQVKQDYAKKYRSELSVDLLDEMGGQDSRDVSRLLTQAPQSDREAFNNARDEVNESRDGIGRWWVDTTWDGTGYMTDESVLDMQRKLSDASAKYKNMSPEERKEMESSIRENIDGFVSSKGAAADMLVDAVIIAGAIAGAKFTGGASLSLIMYTTLAGAAFKVASKSAIMGADYDWGSTQVLTDALTGAIDTGTMFLGPAQLATALKLGEKSAATATRKVLMEGGEQLLKTEMRETFGKGVSKLVSTSIAHGERGVSDKAILDLAKTFAVEGQEETLAAAMKTSLKESFELEGQNALKNLAVETSLNSTAGAVGGGMAGGTRGALEWDSNKSVADNLKMVAIQTGAGALTGATMAGGITLGFKAISAPISKGLEHVRASKAANSAEVKTQAVVSIDENNAFISAETNPHIQGVLRKDGSIVELKSGEKIELQDGDQLLARIDEPERLTRKTDEIADTETSSSKNINADDTMTAEQAASRTSEPRHHRVELYDDEIATIKRNENGLVSETSDAAGRKNLYTYKNEELVRIESPGGNFEKSGDSWYLKTSKGLEKESLDFSVDEYGNLVSHRKDGTLHSIKDVDGTTSIYDGQGRFVRAAKLNLEQQSDRLKNIIDKRFADNQKLRDRMLDLIERVNGREVMERGKVGAPYNADEVALTFREMSRLLAAKENFLNLPKGQIDALAEQLLFSAAHPSTFSQGKNPTCNVSVICNIFLSNNPSTAARMVSEVVLTGKYLSRQGVVDMTHFRLDADSIRSLTHAAEETDGSRNLFGQIMQETLINTYWQKATRGPSNVEGNPFFGEIKPGELFYDYNRPGDPSSGRSIKLRSTGEIYFTTKEKMNSPHMGSREITEAYNLAGYGDTMKASELYLGHNEIATGLNGPITLSSPESLKEALLAAKEQGRLPIIVHVNPSHPVITRGSKWRDIKEGDSSHVITVRDINPETGKLDVINQWSRKDNRLELASSGQASVEELFEAMQMKVPRTRDSLKTYQTIINASPEAFIETFFIRKSSPVVNLAIFKSNRLPADVQELIDLRIAVLNGKRPAGDWNSSRAKEVLNSKIDKRYQELFIEELTGRNS